MSRKKIIYIAGYGRSGSTLLDMILDSYEDFFSIGEFMYFWDRSIKNEELCGCGDKVIDCSEWQGVFDSASKKGIDVYRDWEDAQSLLVNFWWVKKMPLWKTKKYESIANEYLEKYMVPLYDSIFENKPGKIIIDSSKNIGYLHLLKKMKEIDLYIIHLVRDCRAVAFSWKRKRVREEYVKGLQYMPQFKESSTAVRWGIFNSLIKKMGKGGRYLPIAYEKFIENPHKTMESIFDFVGEEACPSNFVGNSIQFDVNHTVAGNPNRLKSGKTVIELDSDWKEKIPFHRQALIKLMGLPFWFDYKKIG